MDGKVEIYFICVAIITPISFFKVCAPNGAPKHSYCLLSIHTPAFIYCDVCYTLTQFSSKVC